MPNMRNMALDSLIKLSDGSFLNIEFQSTVKHSDLHRFLCYAAEVIKDLSPADGDAEVRTIIVYSPNVKKLPVGSVPRKLNKNAPYLWHVFEQILLVARSFMAEFVEKFWPIIADLEAGAPVPALTEPDLAKFYFAPMGKIDDENPGPLAYKFLYLAFKLWRITGNEDIMIMALNGYMARGAPLAAIAIKFWEEFIMMNGTGATIVDMLTDGQFTHLMKEIETLSAEKETLSAEKETLSAEKKTLSAEKETLSAEKETLSAEKETLTVIAQRAILAMSAESKSVVEISELLNISPSEVSNILESAGGDQKRPS
ncbi:MAG: hypothetical protein LBO66_07800 [Deltaproteobacteria bacterium]|nr:hypothetical protein [Deltaproteobacteria bacterium]